MFPFSSSTGRRQRSGAAGQAGGTFRVADFGSTFLAPCRCTLYTNRTSEAAGEGAARVTSRAATAQALAQRMTRTDTELHTDPIGLALELKRVREAMLGGALSQLSSLKGLWPQFRACVNGMQCAI